MAEFCLECFNKMNDTDFKKHQVWLEVDLCEGCGEMKPCVYELGPKPLLLSIFDFFAGIFRR